jgi:hypothetical protein
MESHITLLDVNADEESTGLFPALLTMARLRRLLEFSIYGKRYGLSQVRPFDCTRAHLTQDKSLTSVHLAHSVRFQS